MLIILRVGSVLSDKRWSQPVLVKAVENGENYLEIAGINLQSKQLQISLLPFSEL